MKKALILTFVMIFAGLTAQENLSYQKPSQEILDLVDVPLAPSVLLDNNKEYMVLLYRDAYSSIVELSKEEMRLGGLRIDPATNIGSRMRYYNQIEIKNIDQKEGVVKAVAGLPEHPLIANLTWSPDQKLMAFTQTTTDGVEVWVLDVTEASAKKLTGPTVNANMGDVINWFEDGQSLLVKMVSSDRKALIDVGSTVPAGPTISVADGKKAQNRTYQDLLQNPNDEHNFEQLALSEIHKVSLDGSSVAWLPSAMYGSLSFSPDGAYVMVNAVEKPFSYLVPYYRFPSTTSIYTMDAGKVETVVEVPLIEDLPQGFMATRTGRRSISWRSDKPSTLVFVEALDGGDPEVEVNYRDEVFQLEVPFNGAPVSLVKTINRYS
jgi:dipeptidyl aminopeptidase/acylaminoacyl peptidase